MKPQAEVFLEKAHEFLRKAEELLTRNHWPEDAGRAAYLAAFHAAQGMLFEKTDKVFKTHKGVQGEFGRLVTSNSRFDLELRAFLGQTYNLKAIADYETGAGANVSEAQAASAIVIALRFVATIETSLLSDNPAPNP